MRLYFLDNMRLALIVMVMLFHLALTYSGQAGWYYYEAAGDPATLATLTIFSALGRAFILGIFFMISGYFTPGAFDRKGPRAFMTDRIVRFAIPLVFFAFLVRPTLVYTMGYDTLGNRYSFLANILGFRNVAPGPLWFVEVLLIFSAVYALCRIPGGNSAVRHDPQGGGVPGTGSIMLFICALSLATYLVRIYYPTGKQIFHLRLGNYAQYVAMFIIGIVAFRRNWVRNLTDRTGKLWTALTLPVCALYSAVTYQAMKAGTLPSLRGGPGFSSLAGAALESFICVGMLISLLFIFRKYWNFQGKLTAAMASDSYTVYIMHAPILVYFTCLLRPALQYNPMVKFCIVSAAGTALCFLISHYIRKLPGVKKIV